MTNRPEPDEVSGPVDAGPDPAPATPQSPATDSGPAEAPGPATTGPAEDAEAADADADAEAAGGSADAPDPAAKPAPGPKESERVVVRDRRKIDPNAKAKPRPSPGARPAGDAQAGDAPTGPAPAADAPGGAGGAAGAPGTGTGTGLGAELEALRGELDERVRDLQRITAEYANYRKRVERDRGLVAEQATGNVLGALLPVLDDLDRARDHGDLVGPFASVAEQLLAATGKFGLTAFGEKGDPFDPTRHDAVAHQTSADVTEPTCVEVLRRGYLLGERLLRPAMVVVADPE